MKKHILMIIAVGIMIAAAFASVQTVYADSQPEGCIAFTSDKSFTVSLGDTPPGQRWDGTVEVSTNGTEWIEYNAGDSVEAVSVGDEYSVFFRGEKNRHISISTAKCSYFRFSGDGLISCSGNIENLLDYTVVRDGLHPEMDNAALTFLFYDCANLIKAPVLPAETLAEQCYCAMFFGCTSLEAAPALPAQALAESCYERMFSGCTSLIKAPKLPAEALAENCYESMFDMCTSMTKAPELPAQTLAKGCYSAMFEGCSSLAKAPALPAEELADRCYMVMFSGCTSLTRPPALPAKTLTQSCYFRMFDSSGMKISSAEGTFDSVNYCIPYRIPENGEGAIGDMSLAYMFLDTKGPFTGTPEINTIYYLPDVTDTPLTTMKAKGKKSMTISWEPVDGADGYDIFFGKCSKKKDSKKPAKRVRTIKGDNVSQWTKTKLKKGTAYKAYVRAYVMINGEKVYKKSSPLMHAYAAGGDKKYTNAKAVSVNKKKVTLAQGRTFQIKAKVVKLKKNRKLMPKSHAATLRYLSTDKGIATVNKKGKITAKGAGECYIYAYAHNGVYKKVRVIVK